MEHAYTTRERPDWSLYGIRLPCDEWPMRKGWAYVYGLTVPLSSEVRYIGMTGHPFSRWGQHYSCLCARTSRWSDHLRTCGWRLQMRLLFHGRRAEAKEVERYLIASLLGLGVPLLNEKALEI